MKTESDCVRRDVVPSGREATDAACATSYN